MTSTTSTATRRPGRPRDPQADAAILEATEGVLCEQGFGGFTVDAVAARAGVSKATIYRRWPNKTRFVIEAATHGLPEIEAPDTGSLRDDLVQLFHQSHGHKKTAAQERLMAAIIAEAAVNDEVREVLGEFIDARRTSSRTVIKRAKARGELPAEADDMLLTDMIAGTLLYQGLLRGQSITNKRVEAAVDATMRAFI